MAILMFCQIQVWHPTYIDLKKYAEHIAWQSTCKYTYILTVLMTNIVNWKLYILRFLRNYWHYIFKLIEKW